jgi:hypothetical protein
MPQGLAKRAHGPGPTRPFHPSPPQRDMPRPACAISFEAPLPGASGACGDAQAAALAAARSWWRTRTGLNIFFHRGGQGNPDPEPRIATLDANCRARRPRPRSAAWGPDAWRGARGLRVRYAVRGLSVMRLELN